MISCLSPDGQAMLRATVAVHCATPHSGLLLLLLAAVGAAAGVDDDDDDVTIPASCILATGLPDHVDGIGVGPRCHFCESSSGWELVSLPCPCHAVVHRNLTREHAAFLGLDTGQH